VVVTVGGADNVAINPPLFVPVPVTTQFTGLAHAMPRSALTPDGPDWVLQLAPPSVVVTMLAPPVAVHVVPLMQLMALRAVDPAGAPRSFHWEPPSVVSMA
jgi:hypothetical protein